MPIDIGERFRRAGDQWVTEGGNHVVTVCRDRYLSGQSLNRRTANLINRVWSRPHPDNMGFDFGTNVNYGIMWEKGWDHETIIRPRNGKALRWLAGQRVTRGGKPGKKIYAFAKFVRLPPQKARPFLWPALNESRVELRRLAVEKFQQAWDDCFPGTIRIEMGGKGL